jgi:hypothetical protein
MSFAHLVRPLHSFPSNEQMIICFSVLQYVIRWFIKNYIRETALTAKDLSYLDLSSKSRCN